MAKIYIESLKIEYNGELIITDVDDCLMKSRSSIIKHGFRPKNFYFNEKVYNENKEKIFKDAELTEWGREFISLTKNRLINNFILLTSAENRNLILEQKFNISNSIIKEGFSKLKKVEFLNSIDDECLYIDNSSFVKSNLKKDNIKCIIYPNIILFNRNFKKNFRR